MLTPAEYNALPLPRKRDYALAVDALERMCAEALALVRRAQSAAMLGEAGRGEAERCEIAAMMKRNEIFSRQMEYALQGLSIQVATDDHGNPIRVRRPLGFQSLDALAAAPAESNPLPAPKAKRRAK
jgi:hypothetical protein